MLLSMLKARTTAVSVAVAGVTVLSPGRAAPGPDQPPPSRPASDPATPLVGRLASDSFDERVAAERALEALGPAALPALTAGLRHPNPELARRCAALRNQIRAAETAAFLTADRPHSSPCWPRYRQIVGDTPDGRKLFAGLLADDRRREALEAAERTPAWGQVVYAAAVARGAAAVSRAVAPFMGQPIQPGEHPALDALRRAVPGPEVAALLFLAARPLPVGAVDPPEVGRVIGTAGFADGAEGPLKGPFRKLFAAWLEQRREPRAVRAGLNAALMCGLPEAAPVARRVATDKAAALGPLEQALLVLGHHGGPADRPLLAAWRGDERVVSTATRPDKTPAGTRQVRDVAAGMSLKLAGQDLERYGFGTDTYLSWMLKPAEGPFVAVSMFEADAARVTALAKAWDWLDRNPDVPPKPVP